MKTIKFTAFLLYRYYFNSKSRDIAYFRTLSTLVFLFGFHIAQVLLIINEFSMIPIYDSDPPLVKYAKVALGIIPLYILLVLLIKPSELKKMDFDKEKTKKGYRWLIIYAIASFCFTAGLAIYRNGFQW